MATILEAVMETVTPQMRAQFGEMGGMEQTHLTPGLENAAPFLLAAIGNKTATAKGADELLGVLERAPTKNPMDALTNGQSDALLNQLLGIGANKAAAWFHDTTGINIAPFLALAAPLVMNALHDTVKQQTLDRAGLTALLKNENEAYARAQPQLASEIAAALDAGANVNERAERIRAQFTDDEWNTLAKTPILAGYAVMMSSLSGPVGINKEIRALLEAMDEYGHQAEPDSLVGLVSHEYNTAAHISQLGANRENAATLMRDACLDALHILNEKESYDEKLAYKEFVMHVATRVATAAIDGGIMSIGGKAITREEQQTLDLLAAALAYQP